MPGHPKGCLLFDWGDTLMRVFPEYSGVMADWPEVELLPGVRRVLGVLRRLALLGVATNAADSNATDIRRALRRARVSTLLPRLYCFSSIGCRKTSPEFWAAVLADLELPARRVVMVGDDPEADVEAALRAGLKAVWLNRTSRADRSGEDLRTIHDMAELPEVLRLAAWL